MTTVLSQRVADAILPRSFTSPREPMERKPASALTTHNLSIANVFNAALSRSLVPLHDCYHPASFASTNSIACSISGVERYRFVSYSNSRSTRFVAASDSALWLYPYRTAPTEPWTSLPSSFPVFRASRSSVNSTASRSVQRTSAAVSPGSRCGCVDSVSTVTRSAANSTSEISV